MDEHSQSRQDRHPKDEDPLPEKAKKNPEKFESEKLSQDDELTKRGHD
jgi:hypothetical protein